MHLAACAPKGLYDGGEVSPCPGSQMAGEFLTLEIGWLWTDKVEMGLETVVQVKIVTDWGAEVEDGGFRWRWGCLGIVRSMTDM